MLKIISPFAGKHSRIFGLRLLYVIAIVAGGTLTLKAFRVFDGEKIFVKGNVARFQVSC